MAPKANAQTFPIQSTAAKINITNPSPTAFMQVWGYQLGGAGAAANIGFLNGPGTIGGYISVAAGGSITSPDFGADPVFTVDPNANLVISNPNTANIGGWVRISN